MACSAWQIQLLRLAIGLMLFSCGFRQADCQEPARPNILFVFADDWGRYASAYAAIDGPGSPNDVVRTPNFDRVAREGALFRHAFVNAPSCTPCRSSLLTGQYFWRTGRGAILRGAVWDETIPSFPLLLQRSGYHIGKSYKVWSPGQPADAPFGGQQFAYDKTGRRFNQFSQNVTRLVERGEQASATKQSLVDEVRANFTSFLAARQPNQPFCYWLGPTNVHRQWQQGSGKALWGIEPDSLQGKLPHFLPDVPEVREDFADYLGEIQALDQLLGATIAELERAGELERTVIVVSGDHGPPGFTHGKCNLYDFGCAVSLAVRGPGIPAGRVLDDFVSLPDLAPTFLELAGVARPDVMTAKSLVPILRTTKAGQVDPERTWVVMGCERHVDTARADLLPYPQRAVRTKDYLYIINFAPDRWPMGDPTGISDSAASASDEPISLAVANNTHVTFSDMDAGPTKAWLVAHRKNPEYQRYYDLAFGRRPREELYVLKDDPQQLKNVAAEPEFSAVREKLDAQLMDLLRRSGDPRVVGEGQYFERPPLGGPGSAQAVDQPRRRNRPPAATNN